MSTEKENGKVCLVLLEGIGISEEEERNAVKAANMEYLESLKQNEKCLYYELKANGSEVGLIDGTPGNSGVGILVVGAGKRQYRNIVRINQAIADGQFKTNETLQQVLKEVKEGNNTLHLIGSITDSMEESDIKHLYALLESAKEAGIEHTYIHGILDGEDIPTGRGLELTRELEDWIEEHEYGKIASIAGHNDILDVQQDLTRLEAYYKVLACGDNTVTVSASDYIQLRYDQLEEDSTLTPACLCPEGQLHDNDHIIMFNSRVGSCAILMRTLLLSDPATKKDKETEELEAKMTFLKNLPHPSIHLSSMVQFDASIVCPVFFPPLPIETTFVKILGEQGKKQLRVAEEARYTHIKFLLNGAGDTDIKGDDTVSIHDQTDGVSVESLSSSMQSTSFLVCNALKSHYYDQITTILAGAGKMAGRHEYDGCVQMCKEVDKYAKQITEVAHENGYTVILVSTHSEGAYVTKDEKEKPHCFDVPCFILPAEEKQYSRQELNEYTIENVAATCLKIVGVEPASHMMPALV